MEGSQPLDKSLPTSQVAGIQNKAELPSHQPCLVTGFLHGKQLDAFWSERLLHKRNLGQQFAECPYLQTQYCKLSHMQLLAQPSKLHYVASISTH